MARSDSNRKTEGFAILHGKAEQSWQGPVLPRHLRDGKIKAHEGAEMGQDAQDVVSLLYSLGKPLKTEVSREKTREKTAFLHSDCQNK